MLLHNVPFHLMFVQDDGWQLVRDLLRVDMKKIISALKNSDPLRKKFGYLPEMCKTWIGRLLAESFCERMILNANIVLTSGNTRLNPTEMRQLVVLRMNKDFMTYMKKAYRARIFKAFGFVLPIHDICVGVENDVKLADLHPSEITLVRVVMP